jgi:hypothetical protein
MRHMPWGTRRAATSRSDPRRAILSAMLHPRSSSGRRRAALVLPLALLLAGCLAVRRPQLPVAGVAPLPLRVGLCPAADSAARWLAAASVFQRVEPVTPGATDVDLVVVAMSSRSENGWDEGVGLRDVLPILTLGVLPKVVTHRGEARVTFRRAGDAAACATPPTGADTDGALTVRVAPTARELIAFWLFVPGLVAVLPGWDFQAGASTIAPIDARPWLQAELVRRRAELLRLAGR